MKLVEGQGRRIVARQADVRDAEAVDAVVADGLRRVRPPRHRHRQRRHHPGDRQPTIARRTFRDVVDVNLIGAWNTVDAAIPALIAGGRGGSIVLASSTPGIKASGTDRPGLQAYAASKRGAGRARCRAGQLQLAPHSIRVNTIHPSGVATDMIINETTMALAAAGDPWLATQQNALPIALLSRRRSPTRWRGWCPTTRGSSPAPWPLDAGFTVR